MKRGRNSGKGEEAEGDEKEEEAEEEVLDMMVARKKRRRHRREEERRRNGCNQTIKGVGRHYFNCDGALT